MVFLIVFAIALLTGLNTRAFIWESDSSVSLKFWYFEWHLNGNKMCYACLIYCLICQTIQFFREVNKWYSVLTIFVYFPHTFHSSCKMSVPCGFVILVLWHLLDVAETPEHLIWKFVWISYLPFLVYICLYFLSKHSFLPFLLFTSSHSVQCCMADFCFLCFPLIFELSLCYIGLGMTYTD